MRTLRIIVAWLLITGVSTSALAGDLVHIVESGFGFIGDLIKPNQADSHRDLEEKLTKLGGEDNLVGSSGEFGLLFAFHEGINWRKFRHLREVGQTVLLSADSSVSDQSNAGKNACAT